jgi:hypothetical protein
MRNNLNHLYYAACVEYSSYLQTGIKSFKDKADSLFQEYKDLGGKRTKLVYARSV